MRNKYYIHRCAVTRPVPEERLYVTHLGSLHGNHGSMSAVAVKGVIGHYFPYSSFLLTFISLLHLSLVVQHFRSPFFVYHSPYTLTPSAKKILIKFNSSSPWHSSVRNEQLCANDAYTTFDLVRVNAERLGRPSFLSLSLSLSNNSSTDRFIFRTVACYHHLDSPWRVNS